jgi:flagellar biosynthesis protein FlhG
MKAVHARRPEAPAMILANRHSERVAEEACEYLRTASSHFLGRDLAYAGVLPDDPCLQAAMGAGMLVQDAVDGSPAADAARELVARVVPSHKPPAEPAAAPASFPPSFRRWS